VSECEIYCISPPLPTLTLCCDTLGTDTFLTRTDLFHTTPHHTTPHHTLLHSTPHYSTLLYSTLYSTPHYCSTRVLDGTSVFLTMLRTQFISQVYWPDYLMNQKQNGYLIGWNMENFQCCITNFVHVVDCYLLACLCLAFHALSSHYLSEQLTGQTSLMH
jgi:hypothetical protein